MTGPSAARLLSAWLIAFGVFFATQAVDAHADGLAKVRLYSHDVDVDLQGTLTLNGRNLAGELRGNGTDVTVTGTADPNTIRLNVAGTIILGCPGIHQFMSGIDANEGGHAVIDMTLDCPYRPTYNFVIDITLPPHPLVIPTQPDIGDSASLQ